MTELEILLVEDSPIQLENIALAIEGLDDKQRAQAGIGALRITKANCGAAARDYLAQAVLQERPYDLLLLDLSLPEHPGGSDKQQLGFELLDFAREQRAVKGVIVISVFDELSTFVAPAFQRGALDFIAKPYGVPELQQRFLRALDLVRERYRQFIEEQRSREGAAILDGLTNDLMYRCGSCFSRFLQAVNYETEELRKAVQAEFELDLAAQADHPVVRRLAALNAIGEEAQRDWNALQATFKYDDNKAETLPLEHELRQLQQKLRPCVAVELATPVDGSTAVLSFQDNVRIILREVLIGGLSAAEARRVWHVNLHVEKQNGLVAVRFEDDFPPLDADLARLLNQGQTIAPRREQWRAWGLSVAQHLALRGGGRLSIEPRAEPRGNVITYLIPLARHA
jgi:CheY-like chemotaxis protein